MQVEALGHAAFDGDQGVGGVAGLGFAVHHAPSTMRVPSAGRVGPGEVDGAEGSAREVVEGELLGGDAVDGDDARGDGGEELGRGGEAGLRGEELADALDFPAGDVDEEDVGDARGDGDVEVGDDGLLHEEDKHHLHDAEAECGEQRGGGITGTVEIGEAVTQDGRQREAGAVEEPAQSHRARRRRLPSNTSSTATRPMTKYFPTVGGVRRA